MSGASEDSSEPQDGKISGVSLHLLRGGEPLNPETLRKHSLAYNKAERPPKEYVHNYSNVIHERVGKIVGTSPVGEALRKLRADPFQEFEVIDGQTAKAAGDIFTREFTEFEWMTTYGHSADALKTTPLPSISNKAVSSSGVNLHHRIGLGDFGDVFLGTLRLQTETESESAKEDERQDLPKSKIDEVKPVKPLEVLDNLEKTVGTLTKQSLLFPSHHRFPGNLPREASLHEPIPASNKGRQLLMKMGYKGGGVGKNETGIAEPIKHAEVRKGRDFSGLGHSKTHHKMGRFQRNPAIGGAVKTSKFKNDFDSERRLKAWLRGAPLRQNVYTVVDEGPCRLQVAVKKMRAPNFEGSMKELMDLMHLGHPNIVRFLCACLEPEKLLIVMEYMEMSLDEALHVHKVQMRDDVKMDIMAQMWRGLDYLHKRNVAHCDVKSTNVLLQNVKEGGKGIIAKVTDYGLAIAQRRPEQAEKSFVPKCLSVRYSAPEILRWKPFNLAELKIADVYSMAVTCFELSTEQKPFSSYNTPEKEEKLLVLRRDGPQELRPSDWIFPRFGALACLEKCWDCPDDRPTAQDMFTELEFQRRTLAAVQPLFL